MILPPRGGSVDGKVPTKRPRKMSSSEIRQRVRELQAEGGIRLLDVMSDDEIHQLCDELKIEFRIRDYSPAITLGLFVSQSASRGDACSTVVTQFNKARKAQGLPPVSGDASAYCKARSRLPIKLIHGVGDRVVEIANSKIPKEWQWCGRDVYLVDGFVLRAPDTAENQAAYPQPSSQKEGLGFPQVRVVLTTSLAHGCIVHYGTAKVEGKQTGEVNIFREKHAEFKPDDIVVTDANFESFKHIVALNRRGVDLVCCMNGSRNSPFEGSCTKIEERIIMIKKPRFDSSRFTRSEWESLPAKVQCRVIRYRVSGRQTEITIVTTLLNAEIYSAEAIAELYGLRWDVELDIRSFKSTMGMCDLRCQTPENLNREIAAGVLAHNLVRLLMCDAAAVMAEVHPREISFSRARDAWITYSDELKTPTDLMWIILATIGRTVRNRPNRVEPRAIKRRPLGKYRLLKIPRRGRVEQIPKTKGGTASAA